MRKILTLLTLFAAPFMASASEADLVIPAGIKDQSILYWGFLITFAGFMFGLYQFVQVKKIRAHKSMLDVAQVIFETAKIYLLQQGKFLAILFLSRPLHNSNQISRHWWPCQDWVHETIHSSLKYQNPDLFR